MTVLQRQVSFSPTAAHPARPRIVADLSLALINRTGAYHVCRDLVGALPDMFSATRYWRQHCRREPRGLTRRLLGKAMLFELAHPGLGSSLPPWNGTLRDRSKTLFLDPLYVLGCTLDARDIVLCHDVGPITMPHLFDGAVSKMYARAYEQIRRARPGMVFVSAASMTSFVRCFGTEYRFLEVIPLYTRTGIANGEWVRPTAVQRRFLLTVAAFETRKNYLRAIEGYLISGLHDRGVDYVICGPRGNEAAEVLNRARATPGVINLGFCSDAQLRWLYGNAEGFVLPSLLEGFGLPALEAARQGLLSVISDDGGLREAVGTGAIHVDPRSPEAIAGGLNALVDMPAEERARLIRIAQQHAAALTFERYIESWARLLARE